MVLQTLPSMLLLPFTGVLIDRGDRRRLVMVLDACRGIIILTVAILAFLHRVHIWQLYLMNILVALGFWIFWPTDHRPDTGADAGSRSSLDSNSFLMAAVQGGWVIGRRARRLRLQPHRPWRHTAHRLQHLPGVVQLLPLRAQGTAVRDVAVDKAAEAVENAATWIYALRHEMREGFALLRRDRSLLLLGVAWALFVGAMLTGGIVIAPLSERILHRGAVGYGWLNAGWAVGALSERVLCASLIRPSDGASRVGDLVRRI